MSKTEELEREIEHTTTETASSENVLANLSEEQTNVVQLTKIKEMTVEPGVMKLPVSVVTTAKNSNNWAIEVEHPIEGTLRFYREAPTHGWAVQDGNIVQMLKWYNVKTEDPYQIQLLRVYVKKTGEKASQAHGWELIEPPDYSPPRKEQWQRRVKGTREKLSLSHTPTKMWTVLLVGAVFASLIPSFPMLPTLLGSMISSTIGFVAATIIALMILGDPS